MRLHTRLEVHLPRLARNFEKVQALAPHARVLPMVKANAYGHGLVPVSQFLVNQFGVSALGVATVGEGETLLRALPDYTGEVLVFSDTGLDDPDINSHYSDKRLHPVVSSLEDLRIFLKGQSWSNKPLLLKLDTGMSRLGIVEEDWEEAGRLILSSGRKSICHLMSHFSYSFQRIKDGDKSSRQAAAFQRALSLLRGMGIGVEETSLSNSGAIEQKFAVEQTWVRPGIMLYGPPSYDFAGEVVSSLKTQIMRVFPVKRGTPVGYGVNVTPADGVIAVLAVGYGDGFLTQTSGWSFSHAGFPAKVFGRVNMDMTFLFFPTEALGHIKRRDEVCFWDADSQALLSFAEHQRTHAYQVLCTIGGRVPREYHLE